MSPTYTEIDRMGNSANGRGGQRPRYFLLHTQEGNGTAESLAGYLNNRNNGVSYHYTLRDGVLVDVVDTDLASWSVGDANGYTINLCFAGSFAGWSRAQWLARDADLRIAAWIAVQDARKYGFPPNWLGSGGRYVPAWAGVSDHQYVTDVIGWGSHTDCGPGFPGDVFARYLAEYAGTAPEEKDVLDMTKDELKAVIYECLQTYVGPIGSDVKDIREQLTGGRDLIRRQDGSIDVAASYPGWPDILGTKADGSGRTVTDAVGHLVDQHEPGQDV